MFDDLRSAWGARAPKKDPTYVDPFKRTEFFVHYDGGSEIDLADHDECLARVKQDQAFHMDGRDWSDIGYNGLVCQHGRAVEGRGIDYAGAHCTDHNTSGYGFQFMVGGEQEPTDAAKARMRRLYDECCEHSKKTLLKRGHRDGLATECPGDLIYSWIQAGMPATQEEDDMTPEQDQRLKTIETELLALKNAEAGRYGVETGRYGDLVRRLVAIDADPGVDSAALAKDVAAALPTDLVQRLADEFSKRLEA